MPQLLLYPAGIGAVLQVQNAERVPQVMDAPMAELGQREGWCPLPLAKVALVEIATIGVGKYELVDGRGRLVSFEGGLLLGGEDGDLVEPIAVAGPQLRRSSACSAPRR